MRYDEKNLVCSVCGVAYRATYEPKTPRCPECKHKRKLELHREYTSKQRNGGLSSRETKRITAANAKIAALEIEAAAHNLSYGKYVADRMAGTV